jgi:hypothetical protein
MNKPISYSDGILLALVWLFLDVYDVNSFMLTCAISHLIGGLSWVQWVCRPDVVIIWYKENSHVVLCVLVWSLIRQSFYLST